MSAAAALVEGLALQRDQRRGSLGMACFIVTEALLFACLFFGYFYLSRNARGPWPPQPPRLPLALAMTAALLSSSAVLRVGERALRRGRDAAARLALGATVVLGAGFLVLQALEYRERLRSLRPSTDAYGSIFYVITSVHGAHVLLGLCMLGFVLLLPRLAATRSAPHRPLHDAALYWHFVDAVWLVIVSLLYLLPAVRS